MWGDDALEAGGMGRDRKDGMTRDSIYDKVRTVLVDALAVDEDEVTPEASRTSKGRALVNVLPLREEDAYPAMPEDGYGWEKLFSERMCRHFREDFGLTTRVARFHNVYGPHGTWEGGREKAPAAICRKVIQAKLSGSNEIEIWGDGEQTRSFTYIDDCLHGTQALMASDIAEPLNIGSDQLVTINQLVDIVEAIAGVKLRRNYRLDAPKGVRGRNSDNTLIKERLGWAPSIRLEEGLRKTYEWIYQEMTTAERRTVFV